jgi:transposase
MRIIAQQSRQQKRKLRRLIHKERDAGMKTRLSIILHLAESQRPAAVARALHVARSTVYRVAERFRESGLAGLADRREDNGGPLVDDAVLLELRAIVAQRPAHFGWPRPTWTQEMLATLPKDEVAFYADEVDIHLNPKIGPDWMLPGQQKVVVTPGQNVKRYLAGALDTRSGQLLWVADRHKRSGLFIDLVRHVVRRNPNARCIHLIVDNYSIHSSRQTRLAFAELPQVRLHFLPPYSPDFNPIEREWRHLHAEVTRNHCCTTIDELMEQVRRHLAYRNRVKGLRYKRVA